MIRTRPALLAVLGLSLGATAAAVGLATTSTEAGVLARDAAVVTSTVGHRATAAPTIRIRRIDERRQRDLVPSEDDNPFDKPGLVLHCDVVLGDGLTLQAVEQAGDVTATDAAGTDLSAIEPGWSGKREYIAVEQPWDGPPKGMTVTLLPAARTAETFSARVPLTVTAYRALDEHRAPIRGGSATLPAALFDGTAATVTYTSGAESKVVIKPGSVKDRIEEIALVRGDRTETSMMAMWNDLSATFSFNGNFGDTPTLVLTVRTGLTTTNAVLEVKDEPLP